MPKKRNQEGDAPCPGNSASGRTPVYSGGVEFERVTDEWSVEDLRGAASSPDNQRVLVIHARHYHDDKFYDLEKLRDS